MQGLLADVNVQAHLAYLRHLLIFLDLWPVLAELNVRFVTFAELQLSPEMLDRPLWNYCQAEGWVLFTENRNQDDADSLEATLKDSGRMGHLPVLTLANKSRFEHQRDYAVRVAADVAELMFGISQGEYTHQGRIYVPR